jgi:ADP-ribose pyrophosphatase YjhB (NUDIX family)
MPTRKPIFHPKPGEHGQPFLINAPSTPSASSTWWDPAKIAQFVPGGEAPKSLNGLELSPWGDHPRTLDAWACVGGQMDDLDEPALMLVHGKNPAAGAVIEESDGRVWLVKPTNGFAYKCTFPKGHVEKGLSPQAAAIKEAWEESGLKIQITGFLDDVERSGTTSRYYSAKRVGGTPTDMGWESQSCMLVPKNRLIDELKAPVDHPIAYLIGAPKIAGEAHAWKQVGPQNGSNPGGLFEDSQGERWYCKFPQSANLARNEVLAAKLYEAAGVRVPDCKLIVKEGQVGVASRFIPGLTLNKAALVSGAPGVREGFAADAWLAGWDVCGLVFDNMLLDAGGNAVRVDTGGALLYRAQGAPKGEAFGDKVGEIDTMRSTKNPQASVVFAKVTTADIQAGVARIAKISDATIRDLCAQFGPASVREHTALAHRIISRKLDLLARFG